MKVENRLSKESILVKKRRFTGEQVVQILAEKIGISNGICEQIEGMYYE